MKSLSIITLLISAIAFSVAVTVGYLHLYNVKQINDIKTQNKSLSEDVQKLQQQLAKSWNKDNKDEHGHHGHKMGNAEEAGDWPKFHEATGVIKFITGQRVIVDQEEMPGFMRAMIMSYEVEKPDQLENFKENDKVKLKLKETATDLTVTEISRAK
ncbi:MAG TPA: copper-binding protein [Thermodesulfobacteriota bacterium]|nr:copper-binding protein [Thermodesulfobacteriota bacterium]